MKSAGISTNSEKRLWVFCFPTLNTLQMFDVNFETILDNWNGESSDQRQFTSIPRYIAKSDKINSTCFAAFSAFIPAPHGSCAVTRPNKLSEPADPEKEAWRLSMPEFQTGVADIPRSLDSGRWH